MSFNCHFLHIDCDYVQFIFLKSFNFRFYHPIIFFMQPYGSRIPLQKLYYLVSLSFPTLNFVLFASLFFLLLTHYLFPRVNLKNSVNLICFNLSSSFLTTSLVSLSDSEFVSAIGSCPKVTGFITSFLFFSSSSETSSTKSITSFCSALLVTPDTEADWLGPGVFQDSILNSALLCTSYASIIRLFKKI